MTNRNEKDLTKKGGEERRRKNIESAVRSRERLKNEQNWMAIQMSENEDRMKRLEKKIDQLSQELSGSKSRSKKGSSSSQNDRPKWFGEPF